MKNSLSRPEKLSVKRFALSIYSNCQMRKCPPCKIVRSKWKTNLSKYRKPVICRAVMVAHNGCVYETFGISKRFPIKLQLLLIRAVPLDKPLSAKCFIHVVGCWCSVFPVIFLSICYFVSVCRALGQTQLFCKLWLAFRLVRFANVLDYEAWAIQ